MELRRVAATVALSCSILALTSCLARQRSIPRLKSAATQKLLTADKEALLHILQSESQLVDTLSATVDMVPSLGSANKGKITEYKDFIAYIRYKKPTDIRIIGLLPVVRTTAFDMVATGADFRLYLPTKDRLIEGRNEAPEKPSPNKLENMRPTVFLDALFIAPPTPNQTVFAKDFTDEDNAIYILEILNLGPDGQVLGERDIWFDRLNLHIRRQMTFDAKGDTLSDVRYNGWKNHNGVPFPNVIDINRPQDEYGVVMTIQKVDINKPITDDKFVMQKPPEGTVIQVLGSKPGEPQQGTTPADSSASREKKNN
jgi:outer membrane lipoprotein-sorting protein